MILKLHKIYIFVDSSQKYDLNNFVLAARTQ